MTNISEIEFCVIEYNSDSYKEELDLRNRVLRIPLGMSLYDEQLEAEKDQWHFGAFYNGKLIGTLILAPINRDEIKMRQVAVDEKFQHQNIGTKLVKFAEDFAKNKGYTCITLHARAAAVNFYMKLSYKITGDVFTEIGIPHYKMEKKLIL